MIEQRVLNMPLEEFRKYVPAEGWKLMHVSGCERYGWPKPLGSYFEMIVRIEKEM